MNFKDLDKGVAKSLGLNKNDVRTVLKEVEDQMFQKITFGQNIYIRRIGILELVITPARERYNIGTRIREWTEATYRLKFKISSVLAERIKAKIVYDGKEKKVVD